MGKKILNSKWIYVILSVLLAFVLWLYVGREANPEVTNTLSHVQVVYSGLERRVAPSEPGGHHRHH